MKKWMLIMLFAPCAALGSVNLELSLSDQSGNTERRDYAARLETKKETTTTKAHFQADARGGRKDGHVISERFALLSRRTARLAYDRYSHAQLQWEKDRFQGIRSRTSAGGGIGKHFSRHLDGEIGLAYTSEIRRGEGGHRFASLRMAETFRLKGPAVIFSEKAEFLDDFRRSEAFRLNFEISVARKMSRNLLTKVSHELRYAHDPPPGFTKSDRVTMITFILEIE